MEGEKLSTADSSILWKPLGAVFFWGLSFIATKHLLGVMEPLQVIYSRLVIAMLVLLPYLYLSGNNFRINAESAKGILALALVASVHLWIQVTGIRLTTASNTGWIIGVTPLCITVLAFIFLRERITRLQAAGIALATCGVLILVTGGQLTGFSFGRGVGDLLVLASSVTWGIYSVVNRKVSITSGAVLTVWYLFAFMLVLLTPFAVDAGLLPVLSALSAGQWGALAFLGVFCSGVAYVFWASALAANDSARVASYLYIEPFITQIGALLLLGERLTAPSVLGGVIILAGVALINNRVKRFSA